MKNIKNGFVTGSAAAIAALALAASPALAVDSAAAMALARKSDCLKCHAVDKKKDGPSYKEIAGKYKGKADAAQTLYTHLTTNPMVEVDGVKEEHTSLKTKKKADVDNVIAWILSQ